MKHYIEHAKVIRDMIPELPDHDTIIKVDLGSPVEFRAGRVEANAALSALHFHFTGGQDFKTDDDETIYRVTKRHIDGLELPPRAEKVTVKIGGSTLRFPKCKAGARSILKKLTDGKTVKEYTAPRAYRGGDWRGTVRGLLEDGDKWGAYCFTALKTEPLFTPLIGDDVALLCDVKPWDDDRFVVGRWLGLKCWTWTVCHRVSGLSLASGETRAGVLRWAESRYERLDDALDQIDGTQAELLEQYRGLYEKI